MPVWAQRLLVLSLVAALLVGCAPITADGVIANAAGTGAGSTVPVPTATPAATPDNTATATVITRSLRVRAEPTVASALVGEIKNGEAYPVIARSSDGMWLKLDLPQFTQGSGWVSVDLVTMQGDITDLPIVKIPTPPPPTATPTALPPTATPSVPVTETTPTAEAPAEAPTAVPTEVVTPTVEATEAPTEVVTPTAEATVEPTAAVTATAPTPVATAVGIAAPAAGFATVTAEWRVRVRAEPNTEAPIVGFGYRGETFPVLETSTDGQWVHIGGGSAENADGGWVSTQFLVIGQ